MPTAVRMRGRIRLPVRARLPRGSVTAPTPTTWSRRAVVGGGLVAAAAGLLGCTSGPSAPRGPGASPAADPDAVLRTSMIDEARRMMTLYAAAVRDHPDLGPRLRGLAEHHRSHIAALEQRTSAATTGPSPSPRAAVSPTGPVPGAAATGAITAEQPQASVARLADRERRGSQAALAQCARAVGPSLARVAASVAASRACHATLLGGQMPAPLEAVTGTPEMPGTGLAEVTMAALQAVLSGEHACIYGFGVVGAWSDGAARTRAGQAVALHRRQRDEWTTVILDAGGTPVAALPGYVLPFPVQDGASAARLGVLLEDRLSVVHAGLVAGSRAGLRRRAAGALVAAAVRALSWGGSARAFPGLTEAGVAGTPTGAPTATSRPNGQERSEQSPAR